MPKVQVTRREIVAEFEYDETGSGPNVYEECFLAVARVDEPGTFDFELDGFGGSCRYTITVERERTTTDNDNPSQAAPSRKAPRKGYEAHNER